MAPSGRRSRRRGARAPGRIARAAGWVVCSKSGAILSGVPSGAIMAPGGGFSVDERLVDLLTVLVAAGLWGLGTWTMRRRSVRRRKAATSAPPAPEPEQPEAAPALEPLAAAVQRLAGALEPRAEQSAHPREMADWPEFEAVVETFRRPDVPLGTLRQYALGANWPLACAAFAALARHPERGKLAQGILSQFANLRPWTLFFALRYVNSLERRPPVGAALILAPEWWAENLVIPDLFRTYFAEREMLGDAPQFGDTLAAQPTLATQPIQSLLRKIDHPFAQRLGEELRRWEAQRLDRTFLTSFGRFWDKAEDSDLLAEPEAWGEALDQAESAVLGDRPRSVLVTGEPHVGKTAFLRLLATRLARVGCAVFEASGAQLMADQMYFGQLEGRIRQLVAELDWRKRVLWYAGDLVQLAESGAHRGQAASILDQITPAIASGRLVVLGETGSASAVRLFQVKPSLRALMETCRLEPMGEAEATALALDVATRIEHQTGLAIGRPVIATALELTQHYLGSGQLPGALMELLKRATSRALAADAEELTADHVIGTLSQTTGLPRSILDDKERVDLGAVRQFFAARVMGQDEAVAAVVDRIAMLKAGLVDPDRPVGVFLFAGPTGTGKTELAKTVASFLFGSPERLIRLDMSEFQTAEATVKILGAAGDARQTDSLIERVRKQPFSVLLLDEFEKAHPNTWDLFLQMFDDGRLTDARGQLCDFRHTLIIMTSNLGATIRDGAGLGFLPGSGGYDPEDVLRAVRQTFRPEFVNRFDKVIVFRPLSRDLMRSILKKELQDVLNRRGFRRHEWAVEWEDSAIEFLLDRGFSPTMGARPLKRAIDQHLLAPLAAALVEHRFPEGDQFLFVRSNGKEIEVEFVDPDAEPEVAPPPEAEAHARLSLPAMMLRPAGTIAEKAALAASWAEVSAALASEDWRALEDRLQSETAERGFWERSDRRAVLTRLASIGRVREMAHTAERLKLRLDGGGGGGAYISRQLVARLALQLHLVQEGLRDTLGDAPVDALLIVEGALDAAIDAEAQRAWCARLFAMYRNWAKRRHMQLAEVAAPKRGGEPILEVSGFGAFRTLAGEAGLHILDDSDLGEGRRVVARVKVAAGPWEEPKPHGAYRVFAELLRHAPDQNAVVRRYRSGPAPLVRDVKGGWRSGRLDAVLDGDFDILGAG